MRSTGPRASGLVVRSGLLVACLLTALQGRPVAGAPQATPGAAAPVASPTPPSLVAPPTPGALPRSSPGVRSVSVAEQEAIVSLIRHLYQAYSSRDLEAIMLLEQQAIEASALDAEKRGAYKAEQVRSAFRECHRDVLTHERFAMKPLNLAGLRYQRRGERVLVRSDEPVIATEKVHLVESDMDVRLTISRFLVEKHGETWRIVQMNLL